jgi:hypothetical protein
MRGAGPYAWPALLISATVGLARCADIQLSVSTGHEASATIARDGQVIATLEIERLVNKRYFDPMEVEWRNTAQYYSNGYTIDDGHFDAFEQEWAAAVRVLVSAWTRGRCVGQSSAIAPANLMNAALRPSHPQAAELNTSWVDLAVCVTVVSSEFVHVSQRQCLCSLARTFVNALEELMFPPPRDRPHRLRWTLGCTNTPAAPKHRDLRERSSARHGGNSSPWSFIRVPVRARSCASIPKPICAVARFSGITEAWKTLSSVVCSGRSGWDDGCESTTMNLMQQVRDVRQCPQHPSAHAHKFTHKFAHEFALLEMLNAPSRVLLVPF